MRDALFSLTFCVAAESWLNWVAVDSHRPPAGSFCQRAGAEHWLVLVLTAVVEQRCIQGFVVLCKAEQCPPWDTRGRYTTDYSEKMPCPEDKNPGAGA